jgi:signal transduction histidine kinase
MPGMDGLALLSRIQELRPQTPTLLITGHGDHTLAIQALRGGAYDFIQKPIDRDYFAVALHRAIQTHQLRHQVHEQQRVLHDRAATLEHLVEERTRELVAAHAAKDEFLGIASHELKTPLTSLKAMIQVLLRRRKASFTEQIELKQTELHLMDQAIRRMELLVRDLLNTSLMETGFFALRKEGCDLNALSQSVVEEYIGEQNATLVVHRWKEPVEVDIDVERISQVLLNLLSNARKYSPKGAPISLTVKQEGPMGVIEIADQGSGIPAEQLPHIFDRFYRVPEIEVQSGSSIGVGLGLYIAQRIVQLHEGRIEVHSTPGAGSTFSILLPLASSVPTDHVQNRAKNAT